MYSATMKAIATGSRRLIPDVKKSANSPPQTQPQPNYNHGRMHCVGWTCMS